MKAPFLCPCIVTKQVILLSLSMRQNFEVFHEAIFLTHFN
jgi:hypothetical protein